MHNWLFRKPLEIDPEGLFIDTDSLSISKTVDVIWRQNFYQRIYLKIEVEWLYHF